MDAELDRIEQDEKDAANQAKNNSNDKPAKKDT